MGHAWVHFISMLFKLHGMLHLLQTKLILKFGG